MADPHARIRLNLAAGQPVPPWARELFWRVAPEEEAPLPCVHAATGWEFDGWVPGAGTLEALPRGAPVRLRLAGEQVGALLRLSPGAVRAVAAIDASDPDFVRAVNVALSARIPVSITFHDAPGIRWDDLAECWDRLVHRQKSPVPLQPFVHALTRGAGGQSFSLREAVLQRPVQELRSDGDGRLFPAAVGAGSGLCEPVGTLADSPERLLSHEWFRRVEPFAREAFRDGTRCSTCPGYRACGGFLELFGVGDCRAAMEFLQTMDRTVVALRRDLREEGARQRRRPARIRELSVLVSYACVNECLFCAPADRRHAGRSLEDGEVLEALEAASRQGAAVVRFSGAGEPLLSPSLERLVAAARDLGFVERTVFTNGHGLTVARLERLLDAGANGFLVSVHGLSEVHDRIVGRGGSFDEAAAALAALAEKDVPVTVNTCLVRENLGDLEGLCRRVETLGRSTHSLTLPEWSGNGLRNLDRLARYEEVDRALRALDPRPGVRLVNVPPCIGPEAFDRVRSAPVLFADSEGRRILDSDRAHNRIPRVCREGKRACRGSCCGVDREYLRLVGEGEFEGRGRP